MSLKLHLVRHAETQENKDGVIQGNIDTELVQSGIDEARQMQEYLASTKMDYVICGDLLRQVQTAEIIVSTRGIDIEQDPRLNERDWGRYNGQKKAAIDAGGVPIDRYLFYLKDPNDQSNPDIECKIDNHGETLDETLGRLSSFKDELISKYREADILLVGSQYSNAYLLNLIQEIPRTGLVRYLQENTSMTEIMIHPELEGKRDIEIHHINRPLPKF
jgi:probable phosphoglycerate mutase